jgi:hypothetical protein
MSKLKIVVEGLCNISLPAVKRPALGPDDESTEELVSWGITYHTYSEIAHIRTILTGLVVLSEQGNTPSGMILARHIFEWTAHACYMCEKLGWLVKSSQWQLAFNLLLQADTGNLWARNHGKNYDAPPFREEILNPIDINALIAAYAKYQKKEYEKSTVHDSYSYLSEYAHPNATCLVQYRDFEGPEGFFVSPPAESSFGGITGFILEWLMFMHELLALAKEDIVRLQLVQIMTEVTGLAI